MAEAIGRQVGVPTRALSRHEAAAHFGGLAVWGMGGGLVSTDKTMALLGWAPREIGLIADRPTGLSWLSPARARFHHGRASS